MRIALVAPPLIPVPPPAYGGTELFIAHLAEGLSARGHDVVVYANGESRVGCEVRFCFEQSAWPPDPQENTTLKLLEHAAWALSDILRDPFDIVHLNDALTIPLSRFLSVPVVYTLHHPHEPELSRLYARYPDVSFVAISDAQRSREALARIRTIHHGIRVEDYVYEEEKSDYVCFLGRIAPVKGTHLAIEAARKAGVSLKIAGEIQPMFRQYWETQVLPYIDGSVIEYVGEADHQRKTDLLANARALLFPIQWNEPFGLVMIEAMACGTPVLAFRGGSVNEVVADGVSGRICSSVEDMGSWAIDPQLAPHDCRAYAERYFSIDRMVEQYEAVYAELLQEKRGVSHV